MSVPEVSGLIADSSLDRLETYTNCAEPKTKAEVISILGDTSHKRHKVFRENGGEEPVKTIAVGKIKVFVLSVCVN